MVDYVFPGDSTYFIILGRNIDSKFISKRHISQIGSWLSEDRVSRDLELLYRGSRYGCKASDFHAKCYNKGVIITLIRSIGGFIIGRFSDKSLTSSVFFVCLIKLYCSP